MKSEYINLFATLYAGNLETEKDVILNPPNRQYLARSTKLATHKDTFRHGSGNVYKTVASHDYYQVPIRTVKSLQLSFDNIPQAPGEIVLGHDCTCDIMLPKTKAVTPRHCAITFDDEGRLILRDLGSDFGTGVSYERQEKQSTFIGEERLLRLRSIGDMEDAGDRFRRRFTWILGGDTFIKTQQPNITICIGEYIRLRIVPVDHDLTLDLYLQKMRGFRAGCNELARRFPALGNPSSPDERRNTTNYPVTVKSSVGNGYFGCVSQKWNASSGVVYVVKKPRVDHHDWDFVIWEKEVTALQRFDHPHITKFIGSILLPDRLPQIWLEYVPGGTLQSQHTNLPIGPTEAVNILQQCLSALTYLHNDMKLAHNDIKPANVLVAWRRPGNISVKLGDFGMTVASVSLATNCGSSPKSNETSLLRPFESAEWDLLALGAMVISFLIPAKELRREPQWLDCVLGGLRYLLPNCDSREVTQLVTILLAMTAEDHTVRGPTHHLWEEAKGLEEAVVADNPDVSVFERTSPFMAIGKWLLSGLTAGAIPNKETPARRAMPFEQLMRFLLSDKQLTSENLIRRYGGNLSFEHSLSELRDN